MFWGRVNVTKEKINILMLEYGQNWEIDLLLNVLEQINLYIENGFNSETDKDKVKLSELKKLDINYDNISALSTDFTIENIEEIKVYILKLIEEKVND